MKCLQKSFYNANSCCDIFATFYRYFSILIKMEKALSLITGDVAFAWCLKMSRVLFTVLCSTLNTCVLSKVENVVKCQLNSFNAESPI